VSFVRFSCAASQYAQNKQQEASAESNYEAVGGWLVGLLLLLLLGGGRSFKSIRLPITGVGWLVGWL
jgi:hypothetical protein